MKQRRKRRRCLWWSLSLLSVVLLSAALISHRTGGSADAAPHASTGRSLLSVDSRRRGSAEQSQNASVTTAPSPSGNSTVAPTASPEEDKDDTLYAKDPFTGKRGETDPGAVILYIIGMFYMFFALAIVCDDYFVPALEGLSEKLELSDDVAGATFMAAGGSAPELFTSVLGVFVAKSNVGFGTIVGSAVFNVLFVIGACSVATTGMVKGGLPLTWYPLFRDSVFYGTDLIVLTVFFRDQVIEWWEAMLLLCLYLSYVAFMSKNEDAQRLLGVDPSGARRDEDRDGQKAGAGKTAAAQNGTADELDLTPVVLNPLKGEERRNKGDRDVESAAAGGGGAGSRRSSGANHAVRRVSSVKRLQREIHKEDKRLETPKESDSERSKDDKNSDSRKPKADDEEEDDERWKPEFPAEGLLEQVKFVALFPLNFPLWFTLPDCSQEEVRLIPRYFLGGFFGSIMWIAVFSYFMVWWGEVAGQTMGIPSEVMGFTVLAAGTSVPDLITSVVVARKGFGDMAVSSSIGSNIFDITFGLPLPWFLYTLIHGGSISVESDSLGSSVMLLFCMLLATIASIAGFGWRLNQGLGLICFAFYCVFLTVTLLIEYDKIPGVNL